MPTKIVVFEFFASVAAVVVPVVLVAVEAGSSWAFWASSLKALPPSTLAAPAGAAQSAPAASSTAMASRQAIARDAAARAGARSDTRRAYRLADRRPHAPRPVRPQAAQSLEWLPHGPQTTSGPDRATRRDGGDPGARAALRRGARSRDEIQVR